MKVTTDLPGLQDNLPNAGAKFAQRDGFHWQDGLFFKRVPDGNVRIRQHAERGASDEVLSEIIIPPNEWASIVCSVSHDGEDSERYRMALRFHGEMN